MRDRLSQPSWRQARREVVALEETLAVSPSPDLSSTHAAGHKPKRRRPDATPPTDPQHRPSGAVPNTGGGAYDWCGGRKSGWRKELSAARHCAVPPHTAAPAEAPMIPRSSSIACVLRPAAAAHAASPSSRSRPLLPSPPATAAAAAAAAVKCVRLSSEH